MEKRRYIRRMLRMAALAVGMVLTGGASAWGQHQDHEITIQRYEQYGFSSQDTYIPDNISNQNRKVIRLQKEAGENIDGYIHWYIRKADGTVTATGLQDFSNNYDQYQNGYVWIRPNDGTTLSNDQNSIAYTGTGWTEGDVLVCEASSLNNAEWYYNRRGQREYIETSPMITVVREYPLLKASTIYSTLDANRTSLNTSESSDWRSNSDDFVSLINVADNYFIESYDIYTPLTNGETLSHRIGTNYRLDSEIENYFVSNNQEAEYVRWTAFSSSGTSIANETKHKDSVESDNEDKATVWNHTFGLSGSNDGISLTASTEQIVYITAEVSSSNGQNATWYPVAFMTVHLMPYSEPLTEDELETEAANDRTHYYPRTEDYLEANGYRKLSEVSFDNIPNASQSNLISMSDLQDDISLNYATEPMPNANTNYAFANPSEFPDRKENRLSVGRGEYGLYRTLNYQYTRRGQTYHISKGSVRINSEDGEYKDYFASSEGNYNRYIFDRTYEKNGLTGANMGYFLYLDATDEPGVITNMTLSEKLCPNTKLIVTAWVCDMAHSDNEKVCHADIGITFKGKNGDDEDILAKYYSGKIVNKPTSWTKNWSADESNRALWQQVYFTFSYSGAVDDYESFVVEISNNTPTSNGADYAIDAIEVWCSTPNIQVGRVNACDASTLAVDTDFGTILENMGWNENQDVTTGFNFENLDFRKYRYGLMGTDHTNPTYNSKVGNAYFAFFGGSRQNPKWVAVNNSEEAANVPAVRNTIRVAISTDVSDIPASEEDALAAERELNCRAVEDYNAEIEEWKAENSTLHPDVIPDANIRTDDNAYQTAIQTLYTRLGIPRIRCPWKETVNGQVVLHLTKLSVSETDMKYVGQDENDPDAGHYYVILFRASEVATGESGAVNPGEQCALVSEFSVAPATEILIEADADAETALCLGAYRKITPKLVVYDEDGNEITNESELDNILGGDYIFDWYLSTNENYDNISTTFVTQYGSSNWYVSDKDEIEEKGAVKYAVDTYRSRGGGEDTEVMDADEIRQWQSDNSGNGQIVACADLLLSLLEPADGSDPLLRTGTPAGEVFNLQVNSTEIMAMPYVHAKQGYLFCTNASPVPLPVNGSFVPVILSGIYGVGYTGDLADASVPLRLGLENISTATEITTLKMPVRGILKATTASRLGIPQTGDVTIRLDSVELNYPEVGEVTTLNISNTNQANTVSFYLSADAGRYMEEGKQYRILIPFVQYDSNDQVLASECDGWISLPVKVVPEYQTWKGGATGKWYNDESSWAFSTRSELYNKDDVTNTTENRYSYSPLYFTKITIPEGSELALEDKEPGTGVIDLTGTSGATTNIQYDLAVEDNTGNVGAYYINNVNQIYFKPNATLYRQDYLTYKKAWVDFEMTKGTPYWMASPLKDV